MNEARQLVADRQRADAFVRAYPLAMVGPGHWVCFAHGAIFHIFSRSARYDVQREPQSGPRQLVGSVNHRPLGKAAAFVRAALVIADYGTR